MASYPVTPDGRYFVVKGRLWRCSNPALDSEARDVLVRGLMAARRQVKAAKAADDPTALSNARQQVNACKVALGERGPVWWADGAPDLNQRAVAHTCYAQWYAHIGCSDSNTPGNK
ncbi:hypothetical protein [Pseudomonas sp. NPDC007930]|uniref:hypothetical protein n=1 Tax=Pseudomonas sp. NPDC007930 TaxID=3364417 RepID=UPI0036E1B27C